MAAMTIRNLEDGLKARLRLRAAGHGRSMEDEARVILRAALAEESEKPLDLFTAIRQAIGETGADLVIPPRDAMREPPDFGG